MTQICEMVFHSVLLGQGEDFKGKLTRGERRAHVSTLPSRLCVGWALMGEDVVSEGPQGPLQKIRIFFSK